MTSAIKPTNNPKISRLLSLLSDVHKEKREKAAIDLITLIETEQEQYKVTQKSLTKTKTKTKNKKK